jgi:acetoin:2,6-dichlorophenolindophenol oxidoreductase subunit beta
VIYARALGEALGDALGRDERVVLMGEDIADPYGGAFKVTKGLSSAFPQRVRTTPISEAAIVGVAAGLALAGYRPVVEIMFGDFLGLCFDQVANHIAKYHSMYNGRVTCPVLIRTPSGGGRGYGPTHSQSLEKHFLGIPHLRVLAASLVHEPSAILARVLAGDDPALHSEHKLLYPLEPVRAGDIVGSMVDLAGNDAPPTVAIRQVPREDCAATVVAYGYQAELARRVQARLALEEEVFVELLIPAQLAPLDWEPIEASTSVTGSLLTVEEGTGGWSWGTEIAAEIGRRRFGELRHPVAVLASEPDVIPGARDLEQRMLVGATQIERAIRSAAR